MRWIGWLSRLPRPSLGHSCGSTPKRKRFPCLDTFILSFPIYLSLSISLSFFSCRYRRFDSRLAAALRAREIQFARRKLTHAREHGLNPESGFSQFSKFKEMIPTILFPASEAALLASSPPHSHLADANLTNLRPLPSLSPLARSLFLFFRSFSSAIVDDQVFEGSPEAPREKNRQRIGSPVRSRRRLAASSLGRRQEGPKLKSIISPEII